MPRKVESNNKEILLKGVHFFFFKKEAANEELVTTGDIGEKIGQDDATNLINDIKKDVIKEKPKTKEEINKK